MKISMKLVYQYMAIFINFSPISSQLHPLQVENCDSNSRLVVDEDDNVKSGLKGLRCGARYTISALRSTVWHTHDDILIRKFERSRPFTSILYHINQTICSSFKNENSWSLRKKYTIRMIHNNVMIITLSFKHFK